MRELDRTSRACTLNTPTLRIATPPLGPLSRAELINLLGWDTPIADCDQLLDAERRPLCPVGLIVHDSEAQEAIADEADAAEYHWHEPATQRKVEIFRIIRAAKAKVQEESEVARLRAMGRGGKGPSRAEISKLLRRRASE